MSGIACIFGRITCSNLSEPSPAASPWRSVRADWHTRRQEPSRRPSRLRKKSPKLAKSVCNDAMARPVITIAIVVRLAMTTATVEDTPTGAPMLRAAGVPTNKGTTEDGQLSYPSACAVIAMAGPTRFVDHIGSFPTFGALDVDGRTTGRIMLPGRCGHDISRLEGDTSCQTKRDYPHCLAALRSA